MNDSVHLYRTQLLALDAGQGPPASVFALTRPNEPSQHTNTIVFNGLSLINLTGFGCSFQMIGVCLAYTSCMYIGTLYVLNLLACTMAAAHFP